MKTARYYDPAANPDGAYIPGVPLADLTEEELAALPDHIRAGVDALPFYRKTRPPTAAPSGRTRRTRRAAPARTPAPAEEPAAVDVAGEEPAGEE